MMDGTAAILMTAYRATNCGMPAASSNSHQRSFSAMSLESVRTFLAQNAPDIEIIEMQTSTATVTQAAEAHGVGPEKIAKTLSLRVGEKSFLVVTSGTARLDNRKVKATFGGKASMLDAEQVQALTGHPVGGVCPFGLATPLPIYCDISLKAFDEVVPAAGSIHTAVRINPQRMADLVGADWVDVCQ
jgi:prolyl-tRNA editing enzyme YbaK/EbsC (Cys-tRNA(Pro) deacylase)